MKKKLLLLALFALVALGGAGLYWAAGSGGNAGASAPKPFPAAAMELISGKPQTVPQPGRVTMVDIGAHSCIPCKMMAPIIQQVAVEYDGRAAIVFIDVWENPGEGAKYGVRAIPTQIFYDDEGVERYRHEGFLDKESIIAKLAELGVQ